MTTEISAQAIDRFHHDGFLTLDRLIDDVGVATLRAAYDELIGDQGRAPGDRLLGGLTRQVMRPADSDPVFGDNAALDAGRRIAQQLTGELVELVFDMLIYKPPGHPHETPWHQDAAYTAQPFAAAGTPIPLGNLQFWVALDEVDPENGCMHFVPGRHHRPLLRHEIVAGEAEDPGRVLGLIQPASQLDLSTVVAAPLRAGGCTIHSYGTPHYTPPNRSRSRPRPAYIFNLAPTRNR